MKLELKCTPQAPSATVEMHASRDGRTWEKVEFLPLPEPPSYGGFEVEVAVTFETDEQKARARDWARTWWDNYVSSFRGRT